MPDQVIVSAPSENNFSFWEEKGVKTTTVNEGRGALAFPFTSGSFCLPFPLQPFASISSFFCSGPAVSVLNSHNPTNSFTTRLISLSLCSSPPHAEVIRASDVIILSMKPQHLDEALKSFDRVPNNKLYISILAGISIETLNEKLRTHFNYTEAGAEPWRIVRVIPNTPIMVGAGATDEELIRFIFTYDLELANKGLSKAREASLSDHRFVTFDLERMGVETNVLYRVSKSTNWRGCIFCESLAEELLYIDSHQRYKIELVRSAQNGRKFHNKAYEKNSPLKQGDQTSPAWIGLDILGCQDTRNQMYTLPPRLTQLRLALYTLSKCILSNVHLLTVTSPGRLGPSGTGTVAPRAD
ncbi:hypothetical protein J6590_092655 [Homalodisca vitripennis]|nr:hypothetical protein J6590_092655 [Homalodisca vitripennis]